MESATEPGRPPRSLLGIPSDPNNYNYFTICNPNLLNTTVPITLTYYYCLLC